MKHAGTIRLSLVCLFLIIFTFSCGRKEENLAQPQSSQFFKVITDEHVRINVKVLLPSTVTNEIVGISSSSLTFKSESPAGLAVKTGDVIVADTSSKIPYGTLRKVINSQASSNGIVITTTKASLSDVFGYGSIHIKDPLSSPVSIRNGREKSSLLNLNLSHTFDKDKDPATTTDQVTVQGTAEASPTFIFDWEKTSGSSTPSFVRVGLDMDTKFYVGLSVSAEQFKDKALVTGYNFGVKRFQLFDVPIIFRPELNIYASISLTNPVEASFGFEGTKSFYAAGVFQNGSWSNETSASDLNLSFKPPLGLKKDGKLELSFFNPDLDIHPYDLDGLTCSAGVDLGASVSLDCPTSKWSGDVYLKGQLGINAEFSYFSGALEIKKDYSYEFNIANANLGSGNLSCGDYLVGYIDVSTVQLRSKQYYKIAFIPNAQVAVGLASKTIYLFENTFGPGTSPKNPGPGVVNGSVSEPSFLPATDGQINASGNYYIYMGGLKSTNGTSKDCFNTTSNFPIGLLSFGSDGYATANVHYVIPITDNSGYRFTCLQ